MYWQAFNPVSPYSSYIPMQPLGRHFATSFYPRDEMVLCRASVGPRCNVNKRVPGFWGKKKPGNPLISVPYFFWREKSKGSPSIFKASPCRDGKPLCCPGTWGTTAGTTCSSRCAGRWTRIQAGFVGTLPRGCPYFAIFRPFVPWEKIKTTTPFCL